MDEQRTQVERKILTAAEARKLANSPSKLINCIARNIKEQSEMGQNFYLFALENPTEEALDAIIRRFTAVGYNVSVHKFDREACLSNESEDFVMIKEVHLVFSW